MMTTSLQVVRNAHGEVRYIGALPEQHVFSAAYVAAGGIPAVLAEKAALDAAGEDSSHLNTTPIFVREGDDLVFPFTSGEVRYRFVGFEAGPGGQPNLSAMVFELVR